MFFAEGKRERKCILTSFLQDTQFKGELPASSSHLLIILQQIAFLPCQSTEIKSFYYLLLLCLSNVKPMSHIHTVPCKDMFALSLQMHDIEPTHPRLSYSENIHLFIFQRYISKRRTCIRFYMNSQLQIFRMNVGLTDLIAMLSSGRPVVIEMLIR